ncbi:MAG TPA: divalent-cation tolerance protein CutA [Candidatus Methanoculleus thermohydrogenotrophicum]|jgi:periplasmic divalent cation tolerance protein|nr:divalent-cation tolerance protein CutA [Candidatus Methanoculleus thermohydrogenotrophicum]NLM82633.1 divalent-cation tolerance protein CutA [Candidatus Methanoculleus thermohydrogenotrophicum]HOB18969.1 divalent-cation tolerance protein CutA [Candidatus Methanoculleus thermohydrogenotrophicum]HPZ39020.1 divalent-cation tolerance protein CutA [Candidatus Methanoculleus thermohydrogenotrophicum]HQC90770.1 divalent-cation tolerance protein CutA [Candidatus Methanoculleus thermohydrogenotrophic
MVLPEYLVVFCTAPAGEAEMIAKTLIDARLAACVNVTGVQSCFRWEGTVSTEPEQLLIIKTQHSLLDQLITRIRGLHSYDLPEIIAIPIVGGYAPYLDWIGEETA